jgi:alpha-glucosidase
VHDQWWAHAVIYQVYLRSFADGNGDGCGDIAGLRARLPYIKGLGADAIWVSPWYPSPMRDGGYDIADYQDIDPLFGTLEDAVALFEDAHRAGLRVLVDMVPNHTSDIHPWFLSALSAREGAPARQRYYFSDGKGPDGSLPPNDWPSAFGGPAWSRTVRPDGEPGQWYLHLFAPEQPDLNWSCPDVRADFETILRFWFDLGADGFRLDAVPALGKNSELPDAGIEFSGVFSPAGWPEAPLWDGDGVHDVLRSWRSIASSYEPEKILLGEVIVNGPERFARYLRADELHSAFAFELSRAPWDTGAFRRCIDKMVTALSVGQARPTWFLSSHDEVRPVTRYSMVDQGGEPECNSGTGLAVGTARARAAALLMLALPGQACVYQGEELGLWQIEDLPREALQDPIVARTGDPSKGRDGCRVPVPWEGSVPPFGFTKAASPWLPQPEAWADYTVEHQRAAPGSTLKLFQRALKLRREIDDFALGSLDWLDHGAGVLAFKRSSNISCVLNMSEAPIALPDGFEVILSSQPLTACGQLPAQTAAWLRQQAPVPTHEAAGRSRPVHVPGQGPQTSGSLTGSGLPPTTT